MKMATRIHEWAAGRFSFVQYPNIKPADRSTENASSPLRWKYQMPWHYRLSIAVMSLLTIGICTGVLALLAFLAYTVLR